MPTISTYGPLKIERQVAQGARLGEAPVADMSAIGRGITNLGIGLEKKQETYDISRAEEALLQFERERNELLLNPETGYFNTKSREAYDGAGGAKTALDSLYEKHSQSLESNGARLRFNSAASTYVVNDGARIDTHSSKQLDQYNLDTAGARVEQSFEMSANSWTDRAEMNRHIKLGDSYMRETLRLKGIPEDSELGRETIETYHSKVSRGVIEQAAEYDLEAAKKLRSDMADQLEAPDKLAIDNMLAEKTKIKGDQNRTALGTAAANKIFRDHNGDFFAQNEAINKLDPEYQNIARATLDRMRATDSAAEVRFVLDVATEVTKLNLSRGAGQPNPVEDYAKANPEKWKRLGELAPDVQKKLMSGGEMITPPDTSAAILAAVKSKDRVQGKMLLETMGGVMSPDDHRDLVTFVNSGEEYQDIVLNTPKYKALFDAEVKGLSDEREQRFMLKLNTWQYEYWKRNNHTLPPLDVVNRQVLHMLEQPKHKTIFPTKDNEYKNFLVPDWVDERPDNPGVQVFERDDFYARSFNNENLAKLSEYAREFFHSDDKTRDTENAEKLRQEYTLLNEERVTATGKQLLPWEVMQIADQFYAARYGKKK